MCKKMPDDPFTWLAHWLLDNNPLKKGGDASVWTEQEVGKLSEGQYFGEIALLTNKPRQVTVRADGFVKVLMVERDAFNRVCGPLMDHLKRNLTIYDSYMVKTGATDESIAAETQAGKAENQEEDLDMNEEDEALRAEEEELAAAEAQAAAAEPKQKGPTRGVRRAPVFVEALTMDAAWEPKVVEKSEAEKKRIRDIIKNSVMFSHIEEEQHEIVINAMEEKVVKAGENCIKQGDDGDFFYVIDTGVADVFVQKGTDAPKLVLEYKPGDSFGELALLHGDPRAATVTATQDCRLWALDRDTFRRILMSSSFKKQTTHEGFLENVPILATLTKYERFRLADALSTATFQDGELIIKEGDSGNLFYIVEKGTVVCTKRVLNC